MSEPTGTTSDPGSRGAAATAGDPSLLDYGRILLQRRRVVLAYTLFALLSTLLVQVFTAPVFEAGSLLQIERRAPEILTFKDVMSVDPAGYQDFYETQYKIIQSRSVLELASDKLDLTHRPEFLTRRPPWLQRAIVWVKSPFASEPGLVDLQQRALSFLAGNLSVQPVAQSQLVRIVFSDTDPVLARDVANAIADAYQEFNLLSRTTMTDQASEFLDKQTSRLRSELALLERQLQEFNARDGVVALNSGEHGLGNQALSDLMTSLTAARGRLAQSEAQDHAVRTSDPMMLPAVLSSPLVVSLKQELVKIEQRHRAIAERFNSDWPALIQLTQELQGARQRLRDEIDEVALQVRESARNDYDRIRREVANLDAEVQRQTQAVMRVDERAIEIGGLQSEIEIRRQKLSELVARQSETDTSGRLGEAQASNIRMVDRAQTPRGSVRPRKARNLAIALFLGLGLGTGMALLMHFVDNTVRSEEDLARYAPGLAILGHVPLSQPLRVAGGSQEEQPRPERMLELDPHSDFLEAFRSLRTSILFATPDRPPRRIVITSCEPGAGKSTVATHLAMVLTQLGRRVLLVDGDLRRPRLGSWLRLRKGQGLSSFLTGNSGWGELVQPSEIDGLDVIPSGPIPPNPSELLESNRLDELFERAESQGYDHVVFDSPPILHVTDGLILAQRSDITLLVVRSGSSTREAVTQCIGRLQQARARVAGCVLNAVPRTGGYRYRYGDYSPVSDEKIQAAS